MRVYASSAEVSVFVRRGESKLGKRSHRSRSVRTLTPTCRLHFNDAFNI